MENPKVASTKTNHTHHQSSTNPVRGLVIAGTQSSSGKTLVNAMLLSALKARNIAIQPYKTGPDFIDTAYSSKYAGCPAYNLDFWMMQPHDIRSLVSRQNQATLGIVEGVMGLFDGISPASNDGSTWTVSQLLKWPIILVVPASKQGRSIRATIKGFIDEAGEDCIKGIILNKVAGDTHASYLMQALQDLPVPVVGVIPTLENVKWPERHLGLKAIQESVPVQPGILADYAEEFLELDKILNLVKPTLQTVPTSKIGSDFQDRKNEGLEVDATCSMEPFGKEKRIAIAQDEAFHFYYQENLNILENWGFELIPFSPLYDQQLPPNIDGCIIGGGFPEEYVVPLSQNLSIQLSIRQFIENEGPTYAECGGLMYLSEAIRTLDGNEHTMVGAVPGEITMTQSLQNFGYTECAISNELKGFRGHEFHYSNWSMESKRANLWTVKKANPSNPGISRTEGFTTNRLHASYIHLYFPSAEKLFRKLFGNQ